MNSITKKVICILLFVTAVSYASTIQAQEDEPTTVNPTYRLRHYTVENGLPDNGINAIHQDAQGFMWIATNDGLARFDGYHFTIYKRNIAQPQQGISSSQIRSIYEDSDGELWFGAWTGGVNHFDARQEAFTLHSPYPIPSRPPPRPSEIDEEELPARPPIARVTDITIDQEGYHWWGGPPDTGLVRINIADNTPVFIDPHEYGGQVPILNLTTDPAGNVWISTAARIVRWSDGAFKVYYDVEELEEAQIGGATSFVDRNGRVWFSFGELFFYYDEQTDQLVPLEGSPGIINTLTEDSNGLFWAGTEAGLHTFDPSTAVWQPFESGDAPSGQNLTDQAIRAIFIDREENIWVGTSRGIYVLPAQQQRFQNYYTQTANSPHFIQGEVQNITGINNTAWFALGETLNSLDENGVIQSYSLPDSPRIGITHLESSTKGGIWVAARNDLYYFDPLTEEFRHYPLSEKQTYLGPRAQIDSITEDDNGLLWVTIWRNSIQQINPTTGEIEAFYFTGDALGNQAEADIDSGPFDFHPLRTLQIIAKQGRIWYGNDDSMRQYDPATGETKNIGRIFTKIGAVQDIFVVSDGTIWLTGQTQLTRYNLETEESTIFTEIDGLPASSTLRIEEDATGDLWISTNNGLARFNPDTETFVTYGVSDGLLSSSFTRGASWQAANGRLYFGTEDGLITFNPTDIVPNKTAPSVVLTEMRLFNEPVTVESWSLFTGTPLLSESITTVSSITLNHTDDLVSFEFAALSYGAPEKNRYRYRLVGLESDWNEVSSERRFITYTDLRGGEYYLELQGSNLDGTWGEAETALEIIVLPPWWETTWFRLSTILILAALVWGGFHWRLLSIQNQNRELEREVKRQTAIIHDAESQKRRLAVLEERQRIGRELHDDIGQVIGYVSVQSQAALNRLRQNQTTQAEATIQQLIRVAQDAHTDIRQYILGIRSGETDSHEDFLSVLKAHLQSVDELYGLQVKLSLPSNWEEPPFTHETETQLLRIIQESLNNARKHAQTDQASILFLEVGDTVQMIVADEGAGFDLDLSTAAAKNEALESSAHFGLTIMQERAESFGGSLEIRSAVGAGTQIIVQIPKQLEVDPELAVGGLRVLLVDDHRLYLEGIGNLLRTRGVNVIGMAENGAVAQEMAAELQPDLILMDVQMPVCNGLEATQKIKAAYPQIKIVMLTVAADEQMLYTALQYGASGYLLKTVSGPQFFQMLRDAMQGETALSPQLAAKLLHSFTQAPQTAVVKTESPTQATATKAPEESPAEDESEAVILTFRQQQVLELVVQGMSNREIGEQLFVSENTVKRHVSRILSLFQLKSRYELAHYKTTND